MGSVADAKTISLMALGHRKLKTTSDNLGNLCYRPRSVSSQLILDKANFMASVASPAVFEQIKQWLPPLVVFLGYTTTRAY